MTWTAILVALAFGLGVVVGNAIPYARMILDYLKHGARLG